MARIQAKKVSADWYALYSFDPDQQNVLWAVYMTRSEMNEVKRSADRVLLNLPEEKPSGKQGSVDRSSESPKPDKG